jgi:hypothetical protein
MYTEKDKILIKFLGGNGRMIGSVKWAYREEHPKNLILFNANICSLNEKLWNGDLNLTLDENELQALSKQLSLKLYVFSEMDARFEKEGNFDISSSVMMIDGDNTYLRDDYKSRFIRQNGLLIEQD